MPSRWKLLVQDWWKGGSVKPLPPTYFSQVTDPKRVITQTWDEVAWGYRFVMKQLPPGKGLKVIDLGAGGSGLPIWIAGRGHDVFAVDRVEYQYPSPVRFVHGDVGRLPKKAWSFDVVVSTGSFQLPNMRRTAVIAARGLLKPGGRLIVVVDINSEPRRCKMIKRLFGFKPQGLPDAGQCRAFWELDGVWVKSMQQAQAKAWWRHVRRDYTALGLVLEK